MGRMWSKAMSNRTPMRQGLGGKVPGVIKRVTGDQLKALGSRAQEQGFHAIGRPEWLTVHANQIKGAVLMPLVIKGGRSDRELIRCYGGVVAEGIGTVVFTIDIAPADFKRLPNVNEPWELAELFLYWAHHLPIKEDIS